MSLAAVVLCGGQSRRMGTPKAWLRFGDETLLARTVRRIATAVTRVVVVATPGQALPPLACDVLIAHDPVPNRGPLQGLAVGLAAAEPFASRAFVCATDAPFLTATFVTTMATLAGGHDIAVAADGDHLHPLAAVYATRLHHQASALLATGERRVLSLLDRAPTKVVSRRELLADDALRAEDPELRSLDNINTRADYEAALRAFRARGSPA